MSLGLIGKKIGMTTVLDNLGNFVPVTVIEVGPCQVFEQKNMKKHKYKAIVLGFGERKKNITKAEFGHCKKLGAKPCRKMQEFRIEKEDKISWKSGDYIFLNDLFKEGDCVDVFGTSIGKGFQGVIKRHGFHRGPMSHGSRHHRKPGSLGPIAASRVFKGHKLPGQTGNRACVIQNLKIIKTHPEQNLLLVKGSVPGNEKSYLRICKTVKVRSHQS